MTKPNQPNIAGCGTFVGGWNLIPIHCGDAMGPLCDKCQKGRRTLSILKFAVTWLRWIVGLEPSSTRRVS